jgi:hypothetical protein
MPDALRRRVEVVAFVLLCSLGSLSAAWHMRNWGDALSPVDAFSEANAIREVRNFLDTGITMNDGLGNVLRPGLYPDQGFQGFPTLRAASVTPSGVYTHYPPGPEYLLYAAMRLLGPHPISRLRILPLIITWAAAVFFGLSLRGRFGTPVAAMVMLACATLRLFSDADSYLHDIGYAFALLLVEIGVSVGRNKLVLPFLLLGFLQGWLSFDYVFLVTLVPGATELAMGRLGVGHAARLRLAAWRCVAAGAGFMLAHLLHFLEVWAFFGSFHPALADLTGAASCRAGASEAGGPLHRFVETFGIIKYYVVGQYPISTFFWRPDAGLPGNWQVFRFAGLTLGIWWVVLTHLFIVLHLLSGRRVSHPARKLDSDWLVVSLCGLVPCVLWYVVMLNHAADHTHYLYRHLFFGFFIGALFCMTALVNLLAPAGWRRLYVLPLRGDLSRELAGEVCHSGSSKLNCPASSS